MLLYVCLSVYTTDICVKSSGNVHLPPTTHAVAQIGRWVEKRRLLIEIGLGKDKILSEFLFGSISHQKSIKKKKSIMEVLVPPFLLYWEVRGMLSISCVSQFNFYTMYCLNLFSITGRTSFPVPVQKYKPR